MGRRWCSTSARCAGSTGRVGQIASEKGLSPGETFVHEVTPQMFEILEGLYEAPAPAELAGALVSVTDSTAKPMASAT